MKMMSSDTNTHTIPKIEKWDQQKQNQTKSVKKEPHKSDLNSGTVVLLLEQFRGLGRSFFQSVLCLIREWVLVPWSFGSGTVCGLFSFIGSSIRLRSNTYHISKTIKESACEISVSQRYVPMINPATWLERRSTSISSRLILTIVPVNKVIVL